RIGSPIHVCLQTRVDVGRKSITGSALEEARELAKLDAELRRADDAYFAICDFEIMLGCFHHMAGEPLGLLRHGARGEQYRGPCGYGLAAGEGAETQGYPSGIARNDGDVLRLEPKLARTNLRQHRAQALPDGSRPGENRHPAGIRDAHQPGFERPASRALDPMGEPDSDVTTFFACLRLALREIVPARRGQHLQLAGGIVPAVIAHAGAGPRLERLGVGHLLCRDVIAAPSFAAVQAPLP